MPIRPLLPSPLPFHVYISHFGPIRFQAELWWCTHGGCGDGGGGGGSVQSLREYDDCFPDKRIALSNQMIYLPNISILIFLHRKSCSERACVLLRSVVQINSLHFNSIFFLFSERGNSLTHFNSSGRVEYYYVFCFFVFGGGGSIFFTCRSRDSSPPCHEIDCKLLCSNMHRVQATRRATKVVENSQTKNNKLFAKHRVDTGV